MLVFQNRQCVSRPAVKDSQEAALRDAIADILGKPRRHFDDIGCVTMNRASFDVHVPVSFESLWKHDHLAIVGSAGARGTEGLTDRADQIFETDARAQGINIDDGRNTHCSCLTAPSSK